MKHTAKLPHGFEVTFYWRDSQMIVEWAPDVPTGTSFKSKKAAAAFLKTYQTERNRFVVRIAQQLGTNAVVVDLS